MAINRINKNFQNGDILNADDLNSLINSINSTVEEINKTVTEIYSVSLKIGLYGTLLSDINSLNSSVTALQQRSLDNHLMICGYKYTGRTWNSYIATDQFKINCYKNNFGIYDETSYTPYNSRLFNFEVDKINKNIYLKFNSTVLYNIHNDVIYDKHFNIKNADNESDLFIATSKYTDAISNITSNKSIQETYFRGSRIRSNDYPSNTSEYSIDLKSFTIKNNTKIPFSFNIGSSLPSVLTNNEFTLFYSKAILNDVVFKDNETTTIREVSSPTIYNKVHIRNYIYYLFIKPLDKINEKNVIIKEEKTKYFDKSQNGDIKLLMIELKSTTYKLNPEISEIDLMRHYLNDIKFSLNPIGHDLIDFNGHEGDYLLIFGGCDNDVVLSKTYYPHLVYGNKFVTTKNSYTSLAGKSNIINLIFEKMLIGGINYFENELLVEEEIFNCTMFDIIDKQYFNNEAFNIKIGYEEDYMLRKYEYPIISYENDEDNTVSGHEGYSRFADYIETSKIKVELESEEDKGKMLNRNISSANQNYYGYTKDNTIGCTYTGVINGINEISENTEFYGGKREYYGLLPLCIFKVKENLPEDKEVCFVHQYYQNQFDSDKIVIKTGVVINNINKLINLSDEVNLKKFLTSNSFEILVDNQTRYYNTEQLFNNGSLIVSSITGKNNVGINFNVSKYNLMPNEIFANCDSIKTISFPDIYNISPYACFNCPNLTEVNIAQGTKSIDKSAFRNCVKLESVIIPASVEYIGDYAFYGCEKLKNVYIGGFNVKIGSNAFSNCSPDLNVYIRGKLLSVSNVNAFGGIEVKSKDGEVLFEANAETENYTIPSQINVIDEFCFANHDLLKTVNFEQSSSLYAILKYAFANCSELTNINIGDLNSLKTIEDYAFLNCYNLNINLPENILYIGYNSFNKAKLPIDFTIPKNTNISFDAFKEAINVNTVNFENIQINGFANCKSLTTINIKGGESNVFRSAFDGCSNLQNVYTDEDSSIISIDDYCFKDCSKLSNLSCNNIIKDLSRIPSCAFENCSNLTEINLNQNVDYIGFEAFNNCTNLKILANENTFEKINTIGAESFRNTLIEKLISKSNDIHIYRQAFENCKELSILKITNATIDESAFSGCSKLTLNEDSLGGCKKIGTNAFAKTNITAIFIEDSCKEIGSLIFYGCKGGEDGIINVYLHGTKFYYYNDDTIDDKKYLKGLNYTSDVTLNENQEPTNGTKISVSMFSGTLSNKVIVHVNNKVKDFFSSLFSSNKNISVVS